MPKDKKKSDRQQLAHNLLEVSEVRHVIQKCPYTAVEVEFMFKGVAYSEPGFSKVSWPDQWDEDYGLDLAVERAAFAVAKRILDDRKDKKS